jgi:hypothetical protein
MRVGEVTFVGSALRVRLRAGALELEMRLPAGVPEIPRPGDELRLSARPEAVWRFPNPESVGSSASGSTRSA